MYLEKEYQAIIEAKENYLKSLKKLQESCEHKTILKYTNSDYNTTRVCEDCGYNEQVQWDSEYKYKDKRLCGRAYPVSWYELLKALPRI